jgi:DNA-binding MarR family transcriptional regulator
VDARGEDPTVGIESWPLPALLRGARSAFRVSVRDALSQSGFDDLPPNGPYVLGAIAVNGAPLAVIIQQLGVSKQTAGQLVDTLVLRGYLDREVDPDDRRRLTVRLTPRGGAAAAVVRLAVEDVESRLGEVIGEARLVHAREALAALVRLGPAGG